MEHIDRIYDFQVDLLGKLTEIGGESVQATAELNSLKIELERTNSYLAMIEAHQAKSTGTLSSIALALYVLLAIVGVAAYKIL